jgi:hypothetical protein
MQFCRAAWAAQAVLSFLLVGFWFATPSAVMASTDFNLETATIADIHRAMDEGALSSEQLVSLSLARIKAYEPSVHAIITLNPNAMEEARALDAERRTKGPRSPLHGIPVLVKNNIDTRDLPTTLGFYGLKGAVPYVRRGGGGEVACGRRDHFGEGEFERTGIGASDEFAGRPDP